MNNFRVVSLEEQEQGAIVLVDLNTVPVHMQMDYNTRNKNVMAGHELCKLCDGTGNEFYSMYKKCPNCGGSGRKKND